ncbi:MAG: hypothetical protein GX946_10655 [Oligosphaeraceae bacterium]|nr:hypothetical protein [Oligosphaeraceae bacterium]
MSNRLRQSPIERPGSSGKFPRFNVKPSQQSDNDTTKPNLKPSQQSDNKKPNTTVTPYRTWRRPDGNNTRPPRPERPYIKPPGSSDKNKPAAAVKPRPAWRKPGDNSTRPPGSSLKPPGTSDKNKPTAPPNKPTWRSSSDRRPQSSQKPDYKRPSKPSRAARRGSMRHHHHRPLPHKRRHYYSSWRPYWYYSYFLPRYPRVYYESWYVLRTPAYYLVPDLPEQFRLSTTVGSIVEFELEENVDSGYIWFASYDDYFCQIDIEHLRVPYEPPRYMQKSNPLAAFQIEAFNSGETMLELIYANPLEYELGQEPLKKIQVFLEITEEG